MYSLNTTLYHDYVLGLRKEKESSTSVHMAIEEECWFSAIWLKPQCKAMRTDPLSSPKAWLWEVGMADVDVFLVLDMKKKIKLS